MNVKNRERFGAVALGVAALLVCLFSVVNLRQLWTYRAPTDAVLWQRTNLGLEAVALNSGLASPLQVGDRLLAINGTTAASPEAVAQKLYAAGLGNWLTYTVARQDHLLDVPIRVLGARADFARYAFLDAVAWLYLAIGLFVFYRRQTASEALVFLLFCLASSVLYGWHFTGKLNAFDTFVLWGNLLALAVVPGLLLHFATRLQHTGRRRPWAVWCYLPAVLLAASYGVLASRSVWLPVSRSAVIGLLDRAGYLWLATGFIGAALMLARTARRSATPQARLQARSLSWGITFAIAPFLTFYILPWLSGSDLPRFADAAVLSLALVPLAFVYAIWRHQLLEAEVVLRRGLVYSLATASVIAVYLAVVALAGLLIHAHVPDWGWAGWLLAILVTAALFDPVKRWLQERIDRAFFRERYDYRQTLHAFARQLNTESDLDRLATGVVDRLTQTLSLDACALFLRAGDGFRPACGTGIGLGSDIATVLASHFNPPAAPRLFLERPERIANGLRLAYFLPCQIQGRTVAVLGLGRTQRGEYLTSEDLALVETLAGACAMAVENARLVATLRRQVEEYERLKEFSENIVESIHVGIVAVSQSGLVESWNAQMEVLTARPRQQALGQSLGALLGPAFERHWEPAVATRGISSHSKLPLHLGGRDKIVNLAFAPLLTHRFERVGTIVLVSDVTAEAELEQRLIQADRLRSVGLLAAGVAHEVNTPLAVISSYTQMLARQMPSGDARAGILDTITRQTFRASEIVGNLLNFSRTAGTHLVQVDVNQVVRDTMALAEPPLRSAGIHLVAALFPEPIPVLGDAGKLQQVFLNLILNARDAMPHGGTLRLATGSGPDAGWVKVEDTGEGIPAELHHRIFDPFFTTKSASRQSATGAAASMSTGTGLGLAVTYGIVQEHGGAIRVDSQPGRGSEFHVELPLCAAVLATLAPASA